jgi:hypothetical protein
LRHVKGSSRKRKEVSEMEEACYCGRVGDIEDRELVLDQAGERALRCAGEACGHLECLCWLPDEARLCVFENAGRGRNERRLSAA